MDTGVQKEEILPNLYISISLDILSHRFLAQIENRRKMMHFIVYTKAVTISQQ